MAQWVNCLDFPSGQGLGFLGLSPELRPSLGSVLSGESASLSLSASHPCLLVHMHTYILSQIHFFFLKKEHLAKGIIVMIHSEKS